MSACAKSRQDQHLLDRLSFLASAVAGKPIDVAPATKGPARTDGATVFVEDAADRELARKQVLVHAALLRGGMTAEVVACLRSRRDGLRRYCVLELARAAAAASAEGRIVRDGIRDLPIGIVAPRDADEAVRRALGGERLPDAPASWGVIDLRLLKSHQDLDGAARRSAPAAGIEDPLDDELDDDESEAAGGIAKALSGPLGGGALGRFFQKLAAMGHGESSGEPDGAEATGKTRGTRWAATQDFRVRTSWLAGKPRTVDPPGVSRLLYPEWDCRSGAYRPNWCSVTVASLRGQVVPDGSDDAALRVPRGPLLRALTPIGLTLSRVGRLEDGVDLDMDAVVEAFSDPGAEQDAIYCQLLPRNRDLGVLVLLDCSGSTRDRSRSGATIFDLQREAASLIVDVTSRMGCRTAALGFQSLGRTSVRLIDVKSFDDHWGPETSRRFRLLAPGAYTRIGAAIRHGTQSLKSRSGSARGLLVVITDGFPYDIDYTADYAQADTARALEEARARGIGCVCLSVGSNEPDDALARVFGSTTTAILAGPGELAPLARRLFSDALARADLRRRIS